MLYLVLRNVKLASVISTIASLSFLQVGLLIFGYLVGQFISSYKWWAIARHGGIQVSYWHALRAYSVGMFVNFYGLGLGTVGGDVARGLLIARGTTRKTGGLASVIADRAHGLAVLATIGMVSLAVWGSGDNLSPSFVGLLILGAGLVMVGWFVGPPLIQKMTSSQSRFRVKVDEVARVFPKDPGFLVWISFVSTVFHLSQIGLHYLICHFIGSAAPFAFLMAAIPFVNILATLPVSWNGLGVRETSYKFFFPPAMLSGEQAVALGAIWLFAVAVTSAIGGIVALVTDDFKEIDSVKIESAKSKSEEAKRQEVEQVIS